MIRQRSYVNSPRTPYSTTRHKCPSKVAYNRRKYFVRFTGAIVLVLMICWAAYLRMLPFRIDPAQSVEARPKLSRKLLPISDLDGADMSNTESLPVETNDAAVEVREVDSYVYDDIDVAVERAKVISGDLEMPVAQHPPPETAILSQRQSTSRPKRSMPAPPDFYALSADDINGNRVTFDQFTGKVLVIANVASACGWTEQNYRGLQSLYEKYGPFGLEVLAFPSNQFGGQEPGSNEQIAEFVTSRYGVTFRMMSKVDVNGPDASPVFKYLKQHLSTDQGGGGGVGPGNDLDWNFKKILVDRHGVPRAFYHQNYDGPRLESDVYTYLMAS